MEVKINPNNTNDMFYIICKILGEDNSNESKNVIEKAFKKGDKDNFIFDIELKINGVDFNFVKFVKRLIEEENQCIKNAVQDELKNNFEDIISKAENIIENLDCINIDLEKKF